MICVMCIFLLVYIFSLSRATEILRPRGVPLSNALFYDADKDFTCLDGSKLIPFHYVNDDYCDCQDGSDEPGTAACPNGSFYCMNTGHVALNIPSSRVNDGICDCCDTSDEYGSSSPCINTCSELGRAAREESLKLVRLQQRGFEIRNELKEKGKKAKEEMKVLLQDLEAKKVEYAQITEEKRKLKEEVEAPEREALEVYRQKEEEENKRKLEEEASERRREAAEAFRTLDSNQDDKLDVSELQAHARFDQNRDGEVSEEEARFFLNNQDEIKFDDFLIVGWALMKSYYQLSDSGVYVPPPTEQAAQEVPSRENFPPPEEHKEEYDEETPPDYADDGGDDEEDDDDTEHYEDDENDEVEADTKVEPEEAKEEDKYDEETKRLIEVANKAREEFEKSDRDTRDIEREIKDLKLTLEKDWGPNDEFQPLEGQCFDFTDREYTYTLCPFDKATQKPKNGGTETKLGGWGHWDGPQEDKYSKMTYDKGVQCWNGPMRSAEVVLTCDIENKVTSVSEPSRCEYLFEFSTPAVCNQPEPILDYDHIHTEL